MTSREECEKAYLYLLKHCYEATKKNDTYDFAPSGFKESEVFKQLIEEHFKLKEKYSKILDDVHDYRYETHCMKMTVINLCEHFGVKSEKELQNIYLNKPYKFEDLKPNMWVWDNVAKECLYVVRPFITTGVRVKYFTCLGIWNLEKIKKLNMKFEENRFFPVQCANYLGGI